MQVQNAVKEGIIVALNPVGGTSQRTGNAWSKVNVTLDFSSPEKVRKIEIPFWGEREQEILQSYKVGDRVRIAFSVEGREWQGRLYPELMGYAIEHVTDASAVAPAQQQAPQQQVAQNVNNQPSAPADSDDIPF